MAHLIKLSCKVKDLVEANAVLEPFEPSPNPVIQGDGESDDVVEISFYVSNSIFQILINWNNGEGSAPNKPNSYSDDQSAFESGLRKIKFEIL